MEKEPKFSLSKRAQSFKYAFAGFKHLLRYEHNFKIHFAAAFFVIVCGLYFDVSTNEWCILLITISVVMATEGMNTAVEKLCDLYFKETNSEIKLIKDVAAGSVLITAIFSVCIGLLIFLPKIKM
jgi:diacylglycerol kinase